MLKFITFSSILFLVACSDNGVSVGDTQTMCYLRDLTYQDVTTTHQEYYNQWRHEACVDVVEPGDCASYDSNTTIKIEECKEVTIK